MRTTIHRLGFFSTIAANCMLATHLFAPAWAAPPEPGSADARAMAGFEVWVKSQVTPMGQWCCDLSDGRPIDSSELRITDGDYQVLWSTKHWPDGNNQWIRVDRRSVLPQASPLEKPVAWILNGRVYCLALTVQG